MAEPIKQIAVGSTNYNIRGYFYGTCSTNASTATKAVTCAEFTADDLTAGSIIVVKNTTANTATASSLQLNVNSTGAKPIKKNRSVDNTTTGVNSLTMAGEFCAGVMMFMYDGTNWVLVNIDHWTTNQGISFFDDDYDEISGTDFLIVGTNGISVTVDDTEADGRIVIDGSGVSGSDTKVSRTATTNNAYYRLLMAYTSGTVSGTVTEESRVADSLYFNPSTQVLTAGTNTTSDVKARNISLATHTHSVTTSSVATSTPSTANTGSTSITPAGVVTGSLSGTVLTLGFAGTSDSHTHNLNSHTHNYDKGTVTGTPQ